MTTSSNNQPPQSPNDDESSTNSNAENLLQVSTSVARLIIGLLRSRKGLEFLQQNVVISNLLIGFVLITTGVDVYQKVHPTTYSEQSIDQDVFNSLCKDKEVYESKLAEKRPQGKPDSHPDVPIEALGASLSNAEDVYPVFRWRCRYKVNSQAPLEQTEYPQYGETVSHIVYTGIDLDSYCEEKFSDRNLTKATYHDYQDPNSWYCTNPDSNSLAN